MHVKTRLGEVKSGWDKGLFISVVLREELVMASATENPQKGIDGGRGGWSEIDEQLNVSNNGRDNSYI